MGDELDTDDLAERLQRLVPEVDTDPVRDGMRRRLRGQRRRRRALRVGLALSLVAVAALVGRAVLDPGAERVQVAGTVAGPKVDPAAGEAARSMIGIPYKIAEARLSKSLPGFRVYLSLATDSTAVEGTVSSAEIQDRSVILGVAASATSPTGAERQMVASNVAFPPAGLTAGFIDDAAPAPDCENESTAAGHVQTVRFLHGELVGCMFNVFVWKDDLKTAHDPIGQMPDVVGQSVVSATSKLREFPGGGVNPLEYSTPVLDPAESVVIAQEPIAGAVVDRLTPFKLVIEQTARSQGE